MARTEGGRGGHSLDRCFRVSLFIHIFLFFREALVKEELLKLSEKKIDWKNCVLEFEEEKCIVNELRKHLSFFNKK